MSPRQVDVDELFDRNADSRLLERRRSEELGLPPSASPPSAMPARFGPESMVGEGVPLAAPRGPMLRISVDARPNHELIPGGVVTVVVEVADDGDTDADDVVLRVAVPAECDPVPGSFARDEVAVDGDAVLGEGLAIGTVGAASFTRVRFALRVLPGTEPLDVAAYAAAPGVPAVAGPALRLTRRAGHAAFDAPRPFFELEAGEAEDDAVDEADEAAVEAAVRAVDTVLDEPVVPRFTTPEPDPAPAPAPEPPAAVEVDAGVEPDADAAERPAFAPPPGFKLPAHLLVPSPGTAGPEPPAPVPAEPAPEAARHAPPQPEPVAQPQPEPVVEAQPEPDADAQPPAHAEVEPEAAPPAEYLLARVLDADEVRALERVFVGAVPHGLASMALLSSVAAADGALGRALGVSAFARSVAAALPRALVAARMSRPTPPVVTPAALASITPAAAAGVDDVPYDGPLLVARLDERELEALRGVLARDLADPFLRGVQVLLAIAPRALEGADADAADRVREALAAYRVAAGAWLMRVTVRRAVDKRYDPLTADDPALHDAGRAVVSALRDAVR